LKSALQDQKIAAFGSSYKGNGYPLGSAEDCDLLLQLSRIATQIRRDRQIILEKKKGTEKGDRFIFSATKSKNLLTTNKNGVFRSR